MFLELSFFINSILLGIGLAMDAFLVSIANSLNEPSLKKVKMIFIAGIYGFFQFLMPVIGWFCVHEIREYFTRFQIFIPWIALILLLYIGGKMIYEAFHDDGEETPVKVLTFSVLMIQGIATSIDALSVGFTISDYNLTAALLCSGIIALVTFSICMIGLLAGEIIGTKLKGKPTLFGGIILIGIGIEIFVKGIFLQ